MKSAVKRGRFFSFIWIFLICLCVPAVSARAGMEQSFEMLRIGTKTYKNVTVTTKSKDYVFLLHSAGMANIKVSELTPDELEKLGYTTPSGTGDSSSGSSAAGTKAGGS